MNDVARLLGLILVSMLLALGQSPARAERLLTIGAGAPGGVYHPAAGALCRLINRSRAEHGLRCLVDITDGSLQNIESLMANTMDLGLVQMDVQHDAVSGSGRFEGRARPDLRVLLSLHVEPLTIVARLDAGIERFDDLQGKRVNLGEPQSGTRATMGRALEAFGVQPASVHEMSPIQGAAALCENKIDAFGYVVGHPNQAVRTVSETCATRIVPVIGEGAESLLAKYRFIERTTIPARLYIGSDAPVATVGMRASLMTTSALPEPVAYAVTRAVLSNLDNLRRLHPAFAGLRIEQMLADGIAPFHDGAIRYMREAGLREAR